MGGVSMGGGSVSGSMILIVGKLWKKYNNKGKWEKLCRVYKDGEWNFLRR